MTIKSLVIDAMSRATVTLVLCLTVGVQAGRAAADVSSVARFDIPAQQLPSALLKFSEQSGVTVTSPGDLIEGKSSPGVVGSFDARHALDRLLKDTTLVYDVVDENTVLITSASFPAARSATAAIQSESSTAPATEAPNHPSFWERFRLAQTDSRVAPAERSAVTAQGSDAGPKVEEIVVTAQKRVQRLQDVPISVSVLGGAELDRSSRSVIEELSRVPGVASVETRLGGGTQIAVRGVGSDTLFSGSSPISYYLDSVPFGLVESAIAPDANAYDLERVEVLRGPQGTLYGASAEGGLVRVLTNDANLKTFEFKARTSASTTEGGGGNYRGDVAVNVPLVEDKLAVRAVLGYEDRSGWINNLVEKHINDGQLRNYRLKVNAQPTEAFSIGLSAWTSRQDFGAPPSSLDGKTIPGRLPAPQSTDYDAYGLKLGYELAHVSVAAMSSYLDYQNSGRLDLSAVGFATPFAFDLDSRMYSQELLLNSKDIGAWRWSAGAFFRDGRDETHQEALQAFGYLQIYRQTSRSSAVFGELGRKFDDDRLEWAVGLRYFHDDVGNTDLTPNAIPYDPKQTFSATTPRAVLSWYANDDVTLYASYSQGFRSGFPQNAEVGAFYPDFPGLQPDKLHNYEIGAKADLFGDRLSLDTALYFIDWRGVQQRLAVPAPGGGQLGLITALVNGSSASGPGVDFGLTARPTQGLELAMTVSWNDLKLDEEVRQGELVLFDKGDRLNGSHSLTTSFAADYLFPLGGGGYKGRLSASYNYTSDQLTQFIVANARLRLQGESLRFVRASIGVDAPANWSLLLFGENLGNEQGIGTMDNTLAYNIRPRPRTYGLQLEYRFE